MFTDQRLFRARALEPVLGINEIALVLDQNGPIRKYQSPFMQVLGVEPVFGLGQHGLSIIWTQGTVPAGYNLPSGAPTGTIGASGGSVQFTNPTFLQNGPRQLTQLRFNVAALALSAPPVFDDIDVQVFLPGAVGRFGLLNASPGSLNQVDQVPPPADAATEPAQGSNMTQQTSPPAITARDSAFPELFIFENNGPTFKIINNGSAGASSGSIGLRIAGFRYDLAPVVNDGSWQKQLVMGYPMVAPLKFVAIPTGPFVATGSYGS